MDENKEREIVNRVKDLFGDVLDEYCEQLEKTGKAEITKRMKEKIIEISGLTKTSRVYQNNKDRMPWYLEKTKNETPESILNDCVSKVAISPTYLHSIVTVMLLMPIIAEKLQKERSRYHKGE